MKRQTKSATATENTPLKAELLYLLDQAYNKRAWHGTNLKGSIRGLKVSQALWRPGANRHSIWELAIHAAYWKYIVWRKISGQKKSSFSTKGSNWFRMPISADERQWKQSVALLDQYHVLLRQAVISLPESKLNQKAEKSIWRYIELIIGAASHDLYHAGQIQLLKRIQKNIK